LPTLDRPEGARESTREQWLASGFGLLAWCCFVGGLLWLIGSSSRPVPRVVTPQLSVELFEDVPPPAPTAAAAAPAAEPARAAPAIPPAQDIALKPPPPHPPRQPRVTKAAPAPEPAPSPSPQSALAPAQTNAPSSAQATSPAAADATGTSKTSDNHSADPHADSGAAGPSSSGNAPNGPAHATFQPLPEIPDDYRAEAFAAVALARFAVHPDGSADVSLIEATHNPTLNRLLLTSLRQWRFAAAIKDGHPVETTIELRVHFNVQ
jgi:protein TonB